MGKYLALIMLLAVPVTAPVTALAQAAPVVAPPPAPAPAPPSVALANPADAWKAGSPGGNACFINAKTGVACFSDNVCFNATLSDDGKTASIDIDGRDVQNERAPEKDVALVKSKTLDSAQVEFHCAQPTGTKLWVKADDADPEAKSAMRTRERSEKKHSDAWQGFFSQAPSLVSQEFQCNFEFNPGRCPKTWYAAPGSVAAFVPTLGGGLAPTTVPNANTAAPPVYNINNPATGYGSLLTGASAVP